MRPLYADAHPYSARTVNGPSVGMALRLMACAISSYVCTNCWNRVVHCLE